MEEGRFRIKMGWFRLCCCVMVIWAHAGNAELFLGKLDKGHPLMLLEGTIIPAIIRISIPCFLMMSGYQFFRGFTMKELSGKWKRRVKTLLIPYLVWNLLYYVGYLVANQIDFLKDMINKPGIRLSFKQIMEAGVFYRYNPVFWFMYQLILLVALAPVLYLFLKKVWSGCLFLAVVFIGIFGEYSLPQLNLDAVFYYSVAGFWALHGQQAAEAGWTWKRAFLGAVLFLLGILAGVPYYTRSFPPAIAAYYTLAVFGLWLMVDERRLRPLKPWMNDTFFIYAFHFIPVRFLNKLFAGWLRGSEPAAWLLYLGMPALVTAICCLFACILRRLPWLWKLLNGGRGFTGEAAGLSGTVF